jgi:NADH-ubiquinone oxidoreductase chain 1
MIFIFIWTRASFPRIRFDQLMSFIFLIPCILYGFDIIPSNINLF